MRETIVFENQEVVTVGSVHEAGFAIGIESGKRKRGIERVSLTDNRSDTRARELRGFLQQPDQFRNADIGVNEYESGINVDGHVERSGGRGGVAMFRQTEAQGERENEIQRVRQRW